jgi:hypothetical protein
MGDVTRVVRVAESAAKAASPPLPLPGRYTGGQKRVVSRRNRILMRIFASSMKELTNCRLNSRECGIKKHLGTVKK